LNIKKVTGLLLCLLIIAGCSDDSSSSSSTNSIATITTIDSNGEISTSQSSSGFVATGVTNDLDYKILEIDHGGTIDLSITTYEERDVYFVFTNKDQSSYNSSPTISSSIKSVSENISADLAKSEESSTNESSTKDKVREFNSDPFKKTPTINSNNKSINYSTAATSYSVGDPLDFYDADDAVVPSTVRAKITVGDVNLYVWVEDDSWTGNSGDVTQTMVDEFADKFLTSGSNNDIYDWVVNLAGKPWGPHSYTDLIADTDDIHILLLDIDNDGAGGVLGYYYSRDNFDRITDTSDTYYNDYKGSNEKVMFYIDSGFLSTAEGSTWEITDEYPQEAVSTLAHEFQHMINFYQKSVKNQLSGGAEDWLNEMLSMAVEDLVASKIEADGPRGVSYNDGTTGSSSNTGGRLPLYNYYNERSLTNWTGSIRDYAINYAFGAYLIRNFGGAEFVKSLIQNDKLDSQAVTDALSDLGYSSYDFDTVFNKFATANLLSDMTNAPTGMKFNTGTWFESTQGDITYSLGSINLYNYLYQSGSVSHSGPYIYGNGSSMDSRVNPSSNTYYQAGNDVYGTESYTIDDLDTDVKVTVVIK
jgi:predicted RNA-binding protein with RPS1 domain